MTIAASPTLRAEALGLLDHRSTILDLARDLSRWMREEGIVGAIVGGIAVLLHGRIRTTRDIGVFVAGPLDAFADMLLSHGSQFDASRKEFIREGIPIHVVTLEQLKQPPRSVVEIEEVTTVSLADLIEMKLRSGSASLLRTQDRADAIGLVRRHGLTSEFARHLDKALRPTYRNVLKE